MQHINHKLPMVQNLPVNGEDFKDAVTWATKKAEKDSESVLLSWCGLYDVRVFPNGTFQFISNEVPTYSFVSDTHLEVMEV